MAQNLPEPITREEIYLHSIATNGGGGGGTSDYEDLSNLPQINGHTLIGNKSSSDLEITATFTTSDKPDWEINNDMSYTLDTEAIENFTEEQMQAILSNQHTKAIPVGQRIHLPAVEITDDGTTYEESAKDWVYCGSDGTTMLFMLADMTPYTVEEDLVLARYVNDVDGPEDTATFDETAGVKLVDTVRVLGKVIKKQWEDFVDGHEVDAELQNIPFLMSSEALADRVSKASGMTLDEIGSAVYVSEKSSSSFVDINDTTNVYFGLLNSFNIFGSIALPNMCGQIAPKDTADAAVEIDPDDAEVYGYGGKGGLRHYQFPIFRGRSATNVFFSNMDFLQACLDEKRKVPVKTNTASTPYVFGEQFPIIGGHSIITSDDTSIRNKASGYDRFVPFVAIRFMEP